MGKVAGQNPCEQWRSNIQSSPSSSPDGLYKSPTDNPPTDGWKTWHKCVLSILSMIGLFVVGGAIGMAILQHPYDFHGIKAFIDHTPAISILSALSGIGAIGVFYRLSHSGQDNHAQLGFTEGLSDSEALKQGTTRINTAWMEKYWLQRAIRQVSFWISCCAQ